VGRVLPIAGTLPPTRPLPPKARLLARAPGPPPTIVSDRGRVNRAGAFARRAGVPPKTLRHYERRRLIAPRRNASGYRVYADRELRRVREVLSLKALGLSLTEIRELLAGRRAPLDVLRAHRESLEAKQRLIARALHVIAEAERVATASADRALPALLAEAVWSRAEQQREQALPVPRPPDRAGASRIALAQEALRAIDSGRDLDALRARWRAMAAQELAANPGLA